MSEIQRIEKALLHTKKTLRAVCNELGLEVPSREELFVTQCTNCDTWNLNYKVVEDLDGNYICRYCADLVGL